MWDTELTYIEPNVQLETIDKLSCDESLILQESRLATEIALRPLCYDRKSLLTVQYIAHIASQPSNVTLKNIKASRTSYFKKTA